jgi:hypothetical protein
MIVVMSVGTLITMHPILMMLMPIMVMLAMLYGCSMCVGLTVTEVLRECATGKCEGKQKEYDRFRFHSGYLDKLNLRKMSADILSMLMGDYGGRLTCLMGLTFVNNSDPR